MPTRQYIGARYVPQFFSGTGGSAEWVGNTQYDALTIVTRNGNSYTSRKPVPASVGAPESNPEYWVSTGIFNSQVEQYREEVEELAGDVEVLSTKYDRYVLIVSDSYGVSSGDSQLSFIEFLDDYGIGDSVQGWDYTATAGAAFSQVSNQNSFTDLLDAYDDEELIPLITDIIVVGGTNDAKLALTTTAVSGINAFCVLAESKFPKLKNIDILYTSHVKLSTYDYPDTRVTYAAYKSVMRDKLNVHNAINSFGWDKLTSDKMHPTTDGAKQLAKAVIEFIKTGVVPFISTEVAVTNSGYVTPSDASVNASVTLKPISSENVIIAVQVLVSNYPMSDMAISALAPFGGQVLGGYVYADRGATNALKTGWAQITNHGELKFTNNQANVGRGDFTEKYELEMPNYAIGFVL